MKIETKKLYPDAQLPARGSESAAGYDLHARTPNGPVCVPPGETRMIGTGLALVIPQGYFSAVFARSGLSVKCGLRPANCVGVIDSDYRGEVIAALHNDGPEPQIVNNGDHIAQLVLLPFCPAEYIRTDVLHGTERGTGGFGSTGI